MRALAKVTLRAATVISLILVIFPSQVLRIFTSDAEVLALGMKHYGFWLGDALAGFTPFWVGLIFYFSGKWKKEE